MMKKYTHFSKKIATLIASVFLAQGVIAQNDCATAVPVVDLTGAVCATSAPSLTNALGSGGCEEGTLDTWFQFTAQGPSADIVVSNPTSGWRPEFLVVSGTPASTCAGFGLVSCNDGTGNYTSLSSTTAPLNIGETYWIVVSSNGNNTSGTISVCVTNAAPGPCQDNEACGTPLTIALNAPGGGAACVNDCNTGASAGPDFAGTNCYDLPNATVWYTFTTGATTTTIDISLISAALSDPEFTLFTTANCSTYSIINCLEGTGGSAIASAVAVTANTTYILAVSDATGDQGTFDLCITQNAAPVGNCVDNNECTTAAPLVLNAPGAAAACVTDCNTGATPGPDFAGNNCYDLPNNTVWYSITTDALAATIDVTITSAAFSNPEFTVFTNSCGPYTIVSCVEGTGGTASALNIPITSSTTYLIAVSDATGDQGNFDLCIAQKPDASACNLNNSLSVTNTSMGSPLGGPYQAGESVTFCYSVIDYFQFNCNYVSAFVPTFGDCWDPASFNAQGQPVTINTALNVNGVIQPCAPGPPCPWAACAGQPSGSWVWFPAGSATYNVNGYYPINTPMPAGWYFLSSYDPLSGACSPDPTDPDLSYGDGSFPNCGTNTFDYTVCFTLIVGPSPFCTAGTTDCTVSMKTFADGEFGVWANLGCTVDGITTSPNTMVCPLPAEVEVLTADYEDGVVNVDWLSITEHNTSHFIVSHSSSNSDLKEIGIVEAAGNSEVPLNYRFVDRQPHPGVNYYNLKGVDLNGDVKNHGYVSVNADYTYSYFDKLNQQIILAYSSDVEIYSIDGKLVKTSSGTRNIKFNEVGIFIIRDISTGIIQRIVTN